jgi:hypothetical protein
MARVRNNARVPLRRPLAAALLLIAVAAMPLWLWLGAHVLAHHEHAGEQPAAGLAKALVHGHGHEDGIPDHEHSLLSAPPLRPDPPRKLQIPAIASLEAPGLERLTLSDPQPGSRRTALSGSSPPILHLHCTLLI